MLRTGDFIRFWSTTPRVNRLYTFMRLALRRLVVVVLLSAVSSTSFSLAQGSPPTHPALVTAVTSDPAIAPKLTAQEVAAGAPDSAPPIVGEVVGALPAGQARVALAPRVVSAAIAALPRDQRVPQAPACACAAIRALAPAEQPRAVPAIVSAAVAMAPGARLEIVRCAREAAPELVEGIAAAAQPAALPPDLANPPSSPLPGGTIGRDVLFSSSPQAQGCASPPCP
jgi:hypothetical protein